MSKTVTSTQCPKCAGAIPAEAPQGLCPKCVLRGAAEAVDSHSSATGTAEIPSFERLAAAFPHLEILELIGRGGMGFVFKARQAHLDRLVALKLLPDQLARNPQFTERFHREGRVLARLHHPNIVAVYDFGQSGGFYYLLMEYVDGANLRQAMQAGRFSPAEALALVPKVCAALQYAHEQGILHRDIKPENILLDANGQVKIADFGIAKLVDSDPAQVTLTNTGAALGTPHYMAPEQLEKPGSVDHRADLYSLGVVFYEMLTGELPIGRFAAPSAKTLMHEKVDDVVFRTLAKDRELRFQTANEMKAGVEGLGTGAVTDSERRGRGTELGGAGASFIESLRGHSWWVLAGAAGVTLSLLGPLTMVVSLLTGQSDLGPSGFWTALSSIGFPALGGTIMGWLGLDRIREERGPERSLGLALYAALTWPFLIGLALSIGLPLRLVQPETTAVLLWMERLLVLLLPVGTVALFLWLVRRLTRWVQTGHAATFHRVIGLTVVGAVLVLLAFLSTIDPASPPSEVPVSGGVARSPVSVPPPWLPIKDRLTSSDLDAVRQQAANLTGSGKYAQALERVLWYHTNALSIEPAQVGVRLSFALSQWEQLARFHPEAKAALIATRDRGVAAFRNGGGHFSLFQEVAALNEVLKDRKATGLLFQELDAQDPKLAQQCYRVVEELLVELGEYALSVKYLGDAQQRFDHARGVWQRGMGMMDRTPEENRSPLASRLRADFLTTTRRLIDILVGAGRKEQAISIQKQALAVLKAEELQTAVEDAELRMEQP